jgi:hypothetical protein
VQVFALVKIKTCLNPGNQAKVLCAGFNIDNFAHANTKIKINFVSAAYLIPFGRLANYFRNSKPQ